MPNSSFFVNLTISKKDYINTEKHTAFLIVLLIHFHRVFYNFCLKSFVNFRVIAVDV